MPLSARSRAPSQVELKLQQNAGKFLNLRKPLAAAMSPKILAAYGLNLV
jgi:hypothetical protein